MDNNQEVAEVNKGTPRWLVPAVVILAIVSIAGLGFAWYDSNQLQMAQQASGQLKTAQQNTTQQVATLEQKQAQADATNTEYLGVVAAQVRDEDAQKLARLDTDLKNQLATKASTYELNKDLTTVNGNVNGVKTDLEGTKNDLKMARSELGTLIARNHDEIGVLRRMGERDYVEFTVQGRNKPQKIGDITVELRSVNPKKNQFTVVLIVNDVRTENKNRLSNQPIVFYPHGTHQADEFVVNTVGKDKITGYISLPKSPVSTTTTALVDE
jgi:multidrug efflux pump subunit AcrA (membrane-fusion protein)